LRHFASSRFWSLYRDLPDEIRQLADKNFALLKANPRHPSLHFKQIGELWSARVGQNYRALGLDVEHGIYWIWIGTHADYDALVG